jgi:hypothetical protein
VIGVADALVGHPRAGIAVVLKSWRALEFILRGIHGQRFCDYFATEAFRAELERIEGNGDVLLVDA